MKSNYDGAQNEYRIKETREGYFFIEKKKVRVKWGLFRDKIVEEWVMVNAIGEEFLVIKGGMTFGQKLNVVMKNSEVKKFKYKFESIEEARDAARQIIIDDRLFKKGFIIHPVEVSYQ